MNLPQHLYATDQRGITIPVSKQNLGAEFAEVVEPFNIDSER